MFENNSLDVRIETDSCLVARKKAALDMLGKIENDFALLRDRFVRA